MNIFQQIFHNFTNCIKSICDDYNQCNIDNNVTSIFQHYRSDIPQFDLLTNKITIKPIHSNITIDEIYKKLSIRSFTNYNDIIQNYDCPICLEKVSNYIQKTNCNHYYCNKCIYYHLVNTLNKNIIPTCPLCRKHIVSITE